MRRLVPILAFLTALGGCDPAADSPGTGRTSAVTVDNAWIRLPAVPGQAAAGYARVTATADRGALTGVSSPGAKRIELHETMAHGSMSGMRPVERIAPNGQPIAFEPGGRHMMLFDLDPALKPGGRTELVFHFEHGGTATAPASVAAAGDEAPH